MKIKERVRPEDYFQDLEVRFAWFPTEVLVKRRDRTYFTTIWLEKYNAFKTYHRLPSGNDYWSERKEEM